MRPSLGASVSRRGFVAGAAALAACSGAREAAVAPQNVLVVTLCSVRADRADLAQMPRLTALATHGTRFSSAWANATWTNAAVASILTGLRPGHHRLEGATDRLVAGAPTLPGLLSAAGWRTLASLQEQGPMALDPHSDLLRDFGTVLDAPNATAWSPEPLFVRIAAATTPFFALVTLREAHVPFGAPPGLDPDVATWRAALPRPGTGVAPVWAGEGDPSAWIRARAAANPAVVQSLKAAYDAGVAATDASLGRLLDALEAGGLAESTLVVVVGDHGELLVGHKDELAEAVVRVPLVLAGPGVGVHQVSSDVSQVDVLPTLLEILGVARPTLVDGVSFAGALTGGEVPKRSTITQTFPRSSDGKVTPGAAIVDGAVRVVVAPGQAPVETRAKGGIAAPVQPLDADGTALLETLRLATADTWLPPTGAAPIAPELKDGMRARGYW